jgi:hypothetical protein
MSTISNSTSATSKINVCNTQHQGPSPHLDTTPNMSATSKLNIRNI